MPRKPSPDDGPATGDGLDAALARLLAVGGSGRTEDHPAGGRSVIVPEGYRVERLAPADEPLPDHVKQRVQLTEHGSFIRYVNDFKTEASRVFVDIDAPAFLAVLDYHVGQAPARCAHHAAFAPLKAEQWKRWTAIDSKAMPQAAFAEFIEENQPDIVEPAGADVLEVVANLKARKTVQFQSGIELQTGAVQLTYVEETEGAGKSTVEVPSRLTLGLPVFFNGTVYEVTCFLRYRIKEGKLTFVVKMHQRQYILRDAVQELVVTFAEQVGVPVVYGAPR